MKKSRYNLSHDVNSSFDMGELVPIALMDVVQGDVISMSTAALVRFAPMLAPVMHPTHITIHHWFVPHRLVWDNSGGANTGFEAFITGGPAGTSAPSHPTLTLPNLGAGGVVQGSLADYLGVPIGWNADTTGFTVSALPFRAYALIWNECYRDEDLQTALVIDKTDGADTTTNTTLQHVCWEKDYFTTARPSPQKGTAVTLPLGTTAPVMAGGVAAETGDSPGQTTIRRIDTGGNYAADLPVLADLSTASAASISAFRLAAATQRFMENSQRYGSRFVEYLRRMGIKSSDARLQRPEYLGGGKETIQFSEVLATSEDADFGTGSLYGHGIGAVRSNRFVKYFEEPGVIISMAYITPKTIYMQGLHRIWNRAVKMDYFQPELAFIGQQAITNKEIYAPAANPNNTWGYQDRHDEYRRMESRVAGEFRDNLSYWHFARNFGSAPTLNGDFVSAVPVDTPFADATSDVIYLMAHHNVQAKRIVPANPTPRIV